MTSRPLVSIGLPTYNRAEKLAQSVERLLGQDYSNIEVVISDNASTDGTAELCRRLMARDKRVRYVRQAVNIGPTANYGAVLAASTGELYMATADDDWLDANYVGTCVDFLMENRDFALVCGRSRMYRHGEFSHAASPTTLLSESPSVRVVDYYRTVSENAVFHGVGRRALMQSLPPLSTVLASDWLWIAAIAFHGKISTLESTGIVKHLGGITRSWEHTVATLKAPAWQARYWTEAILANVTIDLWRSPVYEGLGRSGRAALAARTAATLAWKWRIWRRWRGYLRRSRG